MTEIAFLSGLFLGCILRFTFRPKNKAFTPKKKVVANDDDDMVWVEKG